MTSSITDWVHPTDKSGEFRRQTSSFRAFVSAEPGARHPPEKDRYHLYVSLACPWAHRTLIARSLKGLEEFVGVTTVHWHLGEHGWRFVRSGETLDGIYAGKDPHHSDFTHLRQVYYESEPDYSARFTVPVLYDVKEKRIVNNDSADIIRIFNSAFNTVLPPGKAGVELVPDDLKAQIDEANAWIYDAINNGVYKAGFATTQDAYNRAIKVLFAGLDRAEAHLAQSGPYWFGERLTEVDVRLYTTLVRFDPVYVQHFKTNLRDVRSGYPALHRWLRTLYWTIKAFGATTDFNHIKWHYTKSHAQINPTAITPLGPEPHILPLDEETRAVQDTLRMSK